jgi:hypothetical protein
MAGEPDGLKRIFAPSNRSSSGDRIGIEIILDIGLHQICEG